ncbi:sigma-70 family RNA polymerase sigma factor [Glaciihabitans sp. dw_435]|uniref:sigma-70 family RNA polymerase sigma factor n=1 Tax=Glaciihabitans sp. dw_435 TaxID=2720081 RepID=UPI001BD3E312|nr:sigma-70 family RNA polymerase sigma factor [Glaciihabitans sp. dw_435]
MNRLERNQMVIDNLPLVGYLVSKVMAGATHLSRDDLAQAGSLALVKVVDSFDAERGIPFGAYARERIIGALKDEMRGNDWAKRATRTAIKETLSTQDFLSAQLGRVPTVDELAGALGVDRATASESLGFATRTVSTLDGTTAEFLTADLPLAEDEMLVAERLRYLRTAVAALPERMHLIVSKIYFEDMSVGDVAAELGVTHSAVSQQRAEAVRLLRDGLNNYYAEEETVVPPVRHSATGARQTNYLANFANLLSAQRSGFPAAAM